MAELGGCQHPCRVILGLIRAIRQLAETPPTTMWVGVSLSPGAADGPGQQSSRWLRVGCRPVHSTESSTEEQGARDGRGCAPACVGPACE